MRGVVHSSALALWTPDTIYDHTHLVGAGHAHETIIVIVHTQHFFDPPPYFCAAVSWPGSSTAGIE